MSESMRWWQDPGYAGFVHEALAHINEARNLSTRATDTCRLLFLALNKLWNGRAAHEGRSLADTPAFIALLQTITDRARDEWLRSDPTTALVNFTPEVLDHHVLNTLGHRPGSSLSDSDRRDATERHRKIRRSHSEWKGGGIESDGVVKRLAELLYVIRSNIQHGEKTPYGPDHEKLRRDEQVSSLTVPVQQAIMQYLLDTPDEKLVAYGTLKPGGANASVLGGVEGSWCPCILRGRQSSVGGLLHFCWDPHGAETGAMLFSAPGLAGRWPEIDRFEGPSYRRHLVTVTVANALAVANCYEGARDGAAP
jgi:hypothetical protein